MKDKDSTWGSSSSDDDDIGDCMDNSKAELLRKGSKKSLSKLPQPKWKSRQSSRLLLSSSSSEDESCLLLPRHQSQKERKIPASYKKESILPKESAICRKSPPKSRSRSMRKRPLPRPSLSSGNQSDSSSSSSDDSFIFTNIKSLTKMRESKETKAGAIGEVRKKRFSCEKRFSNPKDEGSVKRPGTKLPPEYNVEKRIGEDNATDNNQLDIECNMSGNDSDSDDTAELIRQLTGKSSPQNKFDYRSSVPSQPSPGCSTSSCHKTKPSPSYDTNFSKTPVDGENIVGDDEVSFNDDDNDDNLLMETAQIASISDSKLPPRDLPKDDHASSNTEPFSIINSTLPLDDHTTNNPIGFELPPQSSSSEEDESSGDETEETNGSKTNGNNEYEKNHSFGGNMASKNDEKEDNMEHRAKKQDIFRRHENHRLEEEQFLTQTNQERFETAFDGSNNHDARTTTADKSQNPSRWEGGARNHFRDQPRHHHACIDLVDSDDSEQATTGKVYENEDSPRSPTLRKSPKFNIASRNFLYNKPWRDSNPVDNQQEEVEDVVQYEDDDGRVPTRPRRVTQDQTNRIFNHNNNSGSGIAANGRSSSYFKPRYSSNAAARQQAQAPDQEDNHRSTGVNGISRPWASSAARSARRLRDPAASNLSLAASVVMKTTNRTNRTSSNLTAQNTAASNRGPPEHRRKDANIGDIRTFVNKRPALAYETRNRAKSIESVRSNRHDIQGHSNVTVVNHPPKATGSRTRKPRNNGGGDAMQVFEDEPPPAKRPARRRKATKTKRKRTTTRRTKGRKRKSAGSRAGSRGRKFGKRSGSSNDDSGAWGSTGGGWSSTRPVHKEDPAFRNVGAEIAF